MEQIKSYFKRYPKSNEVFENGGILFHTKGAADSYGKATTVHYTRNQVEKKESSDAKNNAEFTAADFVKGEGVISELSFETLKAYAKELELSTIDNKKVTLIAALEEKRNQLKS